MVDPNRKINRLTEKDIEFLDECEEEFKNRYTNDDEEFMSHCKKEKPLPPIVEPWMSRKQNYHDGHSSSGGGSSGRGGGRDGFRNHHRGGGRYNRRGGKNFNRHNPYNHHSDGSSSGFQRFRK